MSKNEFSMNEKSKQIPFEPGIYKFLDKNKEILYIGKAKSLRKRVKSYFQKNHKSERTISLVSQIKDIEFIITNTELEALILETNLIKEIRPKYNVLMKDDKNYVYIKVTKNEDFPRIYLTRKIEKDGAKYYGPKTSVKRVIQILELIRKIFPIRNCTLEIELIKDFDDKSDVKITKKTINYPCLEYHINRCAAPCIGLISKAYYQEMIDNICRFFEGHTKEIEDTLRLRMQKFAEEKKFEQAAKIRDNLQNIQNITEKQIISEPSLISRDIINYVIHEDTIILTVFVIRNGKLINQENFKLGTVALNSMDMPDLLTYLLKHYYQIAVDFPNEVVVPHEFEDREIIEEYLKNEKGKKVNILIPQKGIKDQLLELARRNALIYSQTLRADFEKEKERTQGAIKNLGQILKIKGNLKRIEAFDISHLGGNETVASMIVFENGKPLKSDYRRFKLRNFQGKIDDFGSMREVLKRRLKYLKFELEEEKNSDVKIKTPNKNDFEKIKKIIESIPTISDFDLKKEDFLAAFKEDQIIGFGRIYNYEENVKILSSLWIDEAFRGKKAGYLIIKKSVKKFKPKRLYLICKSGLKDYYTSFGFKEIKIAPEIIEKNLNNFCKEACLCSGNILRMAFEPNKIDKSFSDKPDLILIDGGKGQLSAVLEIYKKMEINNIPIISIAKKNEEIFLPNEKEPIIISKDSPVLHLLQRIRDESHRFAITYHKNLRDKNLFEV